MIKFPNTYFVESLENSPKVSVFLPHKLAAELIIQKTNKTSRLFKSFREVFSFLWRTFERPCLGYLSIFFSLAFSRAYTKWKTAVLIHHFINNKLNFKANFFFLFSMREILSAFYTSRLLIMCTIFTELMRIFRLFNWQQTGNGLAGN